MARAVHWGNPATSTEWSGQTKAYYVNRPYMRAPLVRAWVDSTRTASQVPVLYELQRDNQGLGRTLTLG
jgi:hypothetical protein